MKVAVVGATGMVGSVMLKLLEQRNFPFTELYPVASERSVGKKVSCKGKEYVVISMDEAIAKRPDIALFSAGGGISLKNAPRFAEVGTYVVDNSSAWRMDETKKLVVPEINASVLGKEDKIIANPNCSTIQMVLALAPLHKEFSIKRLVISTYQSITGTGIKAVNQFKNERQAIEGDMAYPHPIDKNCLPHCDVFTENDYTKEELKLVNETRKIFDTPGIAITATAVRVPVVGGHSESVNIEFEKDFEIKKIKELLNQQSGVVVQDDVANNVYPMPINSHGKDEVFVGRIRRDHSREKCLNLWIVSDNLRKGAATNTVQIAEYIIEKGFIKK